jgi:hypothetical protein
MLKIEFKKIKVAYGITRDIKGYNIRFCSFSNSSNEKSKGGYTIGRSLCMMWRGRLKSKAVKYVVEDII